MKVKIIAIILGVLLLGGCLTSDPIVGDNRPPQMNNNSFTNFVPANTPK